MSCRHLRHTAAACLLVLLTAGSAIAADTGAYAGAKWDQIRDEDGVKVYQWRPPSTGLFAFKADTVIPATLGRVATVLVDVPRRTQWLPKLIEGRLVRAIGPKERVEYMALATPPLVKTRDFVFYERADFDKATGQLDLRFTSTVDKDAPEKADRIRGRIVDSTYTLKPADGGKSTWIEMKVQIDPGGSIPDWMVNFVQKNTPFNTLVAVRKQVQRADVVVLPEVKAVVGDL